MARPDPFVAAYAESFPDEAAAVLGGQPLDEATTLWKTLPGPLAASLLNRVSAPLRTHIVDTVSAEALATCINESDPDEAMGILSIAESMDESRSREVLDRVDGRKRAALQRVARRQAGTVGSALSTQFIRLSSSMRISKALEHIRGSRTAGPICALDNNGRLAGIVDPSRLLAAEDTQDAVAVLVERVKPLSAAMRLASAASDPQWSHHLWLPVADRNRRLLGVLKRDRLVAAPGLRPGDPASGMVSVLAIYVNIMMQLVVALRGRGR